MYFFLNFILYWGVADYWCFWIVLEKTFESLGLQGDQINPKGNQSWISIGRTDAEAEDPILWPPDVKRWFIGKDPDAGKYWGQEQKGATEDVMVGWHHWLKLRERVKDREAWCAAVHGSEQSWTWLSNWTITAENIKYEAEEKILKLSKNSAIIGLRTTYDILKSKTDERLKLCLFTHIAYDWFPA